MKANVRLSAVLALASLLGAIHLPGAHAQVSSATVTGIIKDTDGGCIPFSQVTAIEVTTGIKIESTANYAGSYTLPSLKPGTYDIVSESPGFDKTVRTGVALSAGDHPSIDITMAIGRVEQSVDVRSDPPLLGTQDASLGQTVPQQLVADLPLDGRTPMSFTQYTVGVVATTNPVGIRPFDNSAIAGFSVGGLPNKNSEILIDGSPDNASDNSPAYELPVEATQEVRLQVFESDAAYGHAGGGVANQVSKSGSNSLRGSLDEFHQDNDLDAVPYFSRRTPGFSNPVSRQNQFGGTVGGPIWIPRVYNGKDKLFFFFAYEGFYDSGGASGAYYSVPTAAQSRGDFSSLLAAGSTRTDVKCKSGSTTITSAPYNSEQLFDPASGTIDSACAALGFTVYDRTPFPNNNIAAGTLPLSPIALATIKLLPGPNVPGNQYAQGNYYSTTETGDRYNNEFGRLDWAPNEKHRVYFTGRHNERVQYSNFVFGASNPVLGDYLYRINNGYSVGDVMTISAKSIAEIRLNYTRYSQPSFTSGDGFDATKLGLPALAGAHNIFPRFFFNTGGYTNLGATTQTPGLAPFDSYSLFANYIRLLELHTLKVGIDFRKFQKGQFTFGNSSGLYNFDGGFDAAFSGDPTSPIGSDDAAFLLGLPSSASFDVNAHAVGNQDYLGVFVQDDWRVRPNLTLNFGLRLDKDFSPTEREGTIVSGFDATSTNPYSAAATAAYAAHPNATLPVANFLVNGGLTFAGSDKRFSTFPSTMFSPRIGAAWTPSFLGSHTDIRAGFGLFVLPIFPFNNGINQEGFSQTTQAPIVPGAPPVAGGPGTLANAFPNGLTPPTGSSLGLATFAGQSITFLDPNIRNGYAERWHLGTQHEFHGGWLTDVFYEGSMGRRLPLNKSLDYVEPQYLTTASDPGLSASVPNPFYGLIPNGGSLNSSKNVALTQLLQNYPEFTGITEQNFPGGESSFHALDLHGEHKTGFGLSLLGNLQWSKLLERLTYLNAFDPKPEHRISQYDHPYHSVIGVSYQLPFGQSRKFFAKDPRWLDEGIGGWTVASSWFFQSGAPLTWGNVTPIAGQALDYNKRQATQFWYTPSGSSVASPAGTCPAFNINAFANAVSKVAGQVCQTGNGGTQPVNNIRTFPSQFANLRADALNDWDASILKNFSFTEHNSLQMRLESFNVNNRPVFSGPNLSAGSSTFGQISSTQNSNRIVQLGARVLF